MSVGGDELCLADAGGGVDDGIDAGEAMFEADARGCQRDGLVEWNHAADQRLRGEAVGDGLTSMFGEVFVHLEDHDSGDENGRVSFQVMSEGCGLGIVGNVLKPTRGIYEVKLRTAPSGHDTLLSNACPWLCL